MSKEAQYYEAKRRQRILERRQSLRAKDEIDNQARQIHYQSLYIPDRVSHQIDKHSRCTCTPMELFLLTDFDQLSFERGRNIYPRPKTTGTVRAAAPRQNFQNPILTNRFNSTEYRQQW